MERRFNVHQKMRVFAVTRGGTLCRTNDTLNPGSLVTIGDVGTKIHDNCDRLVIPLVGCTEPLFVLVEEVSAECRFLHSKWVYQFEESVSGKTEEAKEAARKAERELREQILVAVRKHIKAKLSVVS